jgi:hypothetical protein
MSKKTKELTEATEETGGESTAKVPTLEERKEERDACNREIAAVLEKYSCRMTAQVVVGENRVVPQVFIVDERS